MFSKSKFSENAINYILICLKIASFYVIITDENKIFNAYAVYHRPLRAANQYKIKKGSDTLIPLPINKEKDDNKHRYADGYPRILL